MEKKIYEVTLVYEGTVITSMVRSKNCYEVFASICRALAKGATAVKVKEVSVISDLEFILAMSRAL